MVIEHFMFKHPDLFVFIPPYTTRKEFRREEIEGVNYRKGTEQELKAVNV